MTNYDDLADQLGEHIPYRRGPIAFSYYGIYENEYIGTKHADLTMRRFWRPTTPLEDALLAHVGYTLAPGKPSMVKNIMGRSMREQRFPNHVAPQEKKA